MSDIPRDLTRTVFAVLFIGGLLALSLWILRPFLGALIWAVMIVVASWPLMRGAQSVLWGRRWLAGCFGLTLCGMTAYMFDEQIPFFTRGLSFFHFWLPILVVWLVWRLRYDRRAFRAWAVLATGLMLICYFGMPKPPGPPENPNLPVNINYVYGLASDRPQQWLPPLMYLSVMLVLMPLLIYLPTHLLLMKMFSRLGPAESQEIA